MINFLKGLLPNAVLGLGYVLNLTAKGVDKVAEMLTHLGIQMHIAFGTKLGERFKEIEKAVKTAVETMLTLGKQIEAQQKNAANRNESAKLANVIRGENKAIKLVASGNTDDESNSKN